VSKIQQITQIDASMLQSICHSMVLLISNNASSLKKHPAGGHKSDLAIQHDD